MLAVSIDARARSLRGPLIEFMRSQRTRNGRVIFSSDQTPSDLGKEGHDLLEGALEAGLFSALFDHRGGVLSVWPPVTEGISREDEASLGALLQAAVDDNAEKLREAIPRETHLVVVLDRADVSTDPALTPAPRLPRGVDYLWVLLGYYNAKWTHRVWRTTAADGRWLLLRHPFGESSVFVHPPEWVR